MSGRVRGAPHELRGDSETMRELGSRGGHAKAKKLAPDERSAEMQKVSAARHRKMAPEQRSESARNAALARWNKLRTQTNE